VIRPVTPSAVADSVTSPGAWAEKTPKRSAVATDSSEVLQATGTSRASSASSITVALWRSVTPT